MEFSAIITRVMNTLEQDEALPRHPCASCGDDVIPDSAYRAGERTCDPCLEKTAHIMGFRERQRLSGLPEEYHNIRLAEYDPNFVVPHGVRSEPSSVTLVVNQRKAVHDYFLQFCTEERAFQAQHGAFIMGPSGTGKTHLTAALCNRFCWHGYTPKWIDGYSLDRDITSEWKLSAQQREYLPRLAEDIAAYDVIFWEDLQIPEPVYGWYQSAILDIINQISIKKRLLFVTTNHRRTQKLLVDAQDKPIRGQSPNLWLEKAYGEKFLSRLDSLCKRFPLTGPDMRSQP